MQFSQQRRPHAEAGGADIRVSSVFHPWILKTVAPSNVPKSCRLRGSLMNQHLRANLWLLVTSVLICSVAYPGVLWFVGRALFRDKAEGSLIRDKDGETVVGSRLIAQPFS